MLYETVKELLANDKFVVTLGDEHTISLAIIEVHMSLTSVRSFLTASPLGCWLPHAPGLSRGFQQQILDLAVHAAQLICRPFLQ